MNTYENVMGSKPLLSMARDFQVEWMTLERSSAEGRLPESFFWFVGTTLAVSPEDRAGVASLLAASSVWNGMSQPPRPMLDDMVRHDPEGSRTAVQWLSRLSEVVQALMNLWAEPGLKTPRLRQLVCDGGPSLTGLAAALLGAGDVLVDHDHGSPICVDPDHPATASVLASYPKYYGGREVYSAVPAQVLDEVVGWSLPRALEGTESEALSEFWSFVDACQTVAGLHLEKAEGSPLVRCLKVYYAVHDVYGDRGALLAYVLRLTPVLFGLAPGLVKTEREFVALLKAGMDAPTSRQLPGRAQTADGDLELLADQPDHYVARPAGGGRAFRLPKKAENSSYVVHSPPPTSSSLLDGDLHGVARFNRHPEQRALIHGADPAQWATTPPAHAFGGYGRWVNVADGRLAYLKPGMVREAELEATYHNLAHDFFGLGAHVPTTAVFDDPSTGERKSISACVVGAEHVRTTHAPHHRQILHALATTGDLDRLAVMDGVMGHDDRDGRTNYVFGGGTIHLIDNGAFERPELPHYWTSHHGPDGMGLPLHPAAAEWVKGLDPAEFQRQLESHGMSHEVVAGRVRALEDLRAALAHKGPALTRQEAWQALRGDGLAKSELLIKADVVRPSSTLQGDEGYLYHATNEERAHGIAEDGRMHLHRPGDFTEQDCWPDGATEKRSGYFAPHDKAHTVWSFAPEEGRSAVLRIHHLAHPFRRESGTGDLFSKKAVPAKLFEINTSEGWKPLVDWHREVSKSEDLSKMARLTSDEVADRMTPHTPSDWEGIDRVESFDLGKGLWHHVVHKGKMESGFEPLLHTLSLSPDPYENAQVVSSASANREPADKFWGDSWNIQHAGANLPWRDGLIPTQGEVATQGYYQGRGYGTRLYQEMLKYHGRLASDSGVSNAANKVWQRLGSDKAPLPMQDPSFKPTKVFFGAKPEERHWAEYDGPRPTPTTVRHQGGYAQTELDRMGSEIDRDMSLADRETDQYGEPVPQRFRDSWRADALRRKNHLEDVRAGKTTVRTRGR